MSSSSGPQNRATASVPRGGTGVTATPANSTRDETSRNQRYGMRARPDIVGKEMERETLGDKIRRTSDHAIGKDSSATIGEKFGFGRGGTTGPDTTSSTSGSSFADKAADTVGSATRSAKSAAGNILGGAGAVSSDRGGYDSTRSHEGYGLGARSSDDHMARGPVSTRSPRAGYGHDAGIDHLARSREGYGSQDRGRGKLMSGKEMSNDFLINYDQELKDEVGGA